MRSPGSRDLRYPEPISIGPWREEISRHHASALDLDGLASLGLEPSFQGVQGFGRDMDAAGLPEGLHAARDVHGVTPDIVDELVLADDPGRHRARVQPDPDTQLLPERAADLGHGGRHPRQIRRRGKR